MFFGVTSPLYNRLVKNNIITGGLGCGTTKLGNYLLVSAGSYSDNLSVLGEEIKKTFNELKDFNEEKFELDKKQTILDLILRDENIGNMVMPFVNNIITYNCDYPDSKEQVDGYTYEDFVKTMKEIDFSNYTVTAIKN